MLATPTAARASGPGRLQHALDQQLPGGGHHHHRGDQVGAAAVVLLGRARRVVRAGLVGADRLVLDPVVGGELAVAQRDHRGHQRPAPPARTSPPGAAAAGPQRAADARGDQHRAQHPRVLERKASCGQPQPHQRDQGERFGQAQRAAQQRHPPRQARRQHGLGPRGDADLGPWSRARPPTTRSARGSAARCAGPSRPAAGWASAALTRARGSRLVLGAHPSILCARSQKNPADSSTSAAGTRSSAPWISGAASSRPIARWGQKP